MRETVEMLLLDAAEWPPTIWVVLTAREHLTRAQCTDHLRQLRRAARRRWPDVQWFVQVEFQRRGALHLNLLVKGVPDDDLAALYELLTGLWCDRVDATAGPFEDMASGGQWCGRVADAGGVTKYLAKTLGHGLKAEQAPPLGWKGHRTSQTRGYLVRPASEMREEARDSLFEKAALVRATALELAGDEAEDYVDWQWSIRLGSRWGITQRTPKRHKTTFVVCPSGWVEPTPDPPVSKRISRKAAGYRAARDEIEGLRQAVALAAERERRGWAQLPLWAARCPTGGRLSMPGPPAGPSHIRRRT